MAQASARAGAGAEVSNYWLGDRFSHWREESGPDDRAVDGAIQAIRTAIGGGPEGMLRGERFVDVDAEARLAAAVHVSFANFRRARQHLSRNLREVILLLDAEAETRDIHV